MSNVVQIERNSLLSYFNRIINYGAIFLLFMWQAIDNLLREIEYQSFSKFKNFWLFLMLALFAFELECLVRNKKKLLFVDGLQCVFKLVIVISLLSLYCSIKNNGYSISTFTGIIKIVIPVVFAFSIVNLLPFKDIYQIMYIFLIISFVLYLYIIGIDNLKLQNFMSISFMNSYCPFESSFFSPTAIAMVIFFSYYNKKKMPLLLSLVFTVMTFKRMMILFAVFICFFGFALKKIKVISYIWIYITEAFILFLFFVYMLALNGYFNEVLIKIFGMNMNQFTMGRVWLFDSLKNSDFLSYGISSSVDFQRSIEMDFPMFYLEMGIISIFAFIYYLYKMVKNNLYAYVILSFCMLEMLTSHFYDITYFWMILYLTIGCILYRSDGERYSNNNFLGLKKRYKIKI